MKKLAAFLCAVIAVLAAVAAVGCGARQPVTADENTVFITAVDSFFDFENKTLKDYMDFLQANGKLTYTISGGMVGSINGKANTSNSYWMLYTDDKENSNGGWGTFEHEGKEYGSAILGVEQLPVKQNCAYVWAYQTF